MQNQAFIGSKLGPENCFATTVTVSSYNSLLFSNTTKQIHYADVYPLYYTFCTIDIQQKKNFFRF